MALLAGAVSVYSQGTVSMIDYGGNFGIQVFQAQPLADSTVFVSTPSGSGYEEMGQPANPYLPNPGTTVYTASPSTIGPGYDVGLLALAGGGATNYSQLSFVTNSIITNWYTTNGYISTVTNLYGVWFSAVNANVPGTGTNASVAIAVWQNSGAAGAVTTLAEAQSNGYAWGVSSIGTVGLATGIEFPPDLPSSITSFSLVQNGLLSFVGNLAFGAVPIGSTSNVTLTINNLSSNTVDIDNITASPGFGVSITNTNIAAGTNLSVNVTFTPTTIASYLGNVTIVSQTNTMTNTIAVSGNGVSPISLTGNLNFGVVPIGSSSNLTLTINNLGTTNLTVTNITYPAGFALSATNGTVDALSSLPVTVTFSPTAPTNYGGTLTVYSDLSNGSPSIAVSGFGDDTNNSMFVLVVLTNGLGTVRPLNAGTRTFKAGQSITLAATPNPGNLFSNWAGSTNTTKNPLTIVMSTNKVIEANFVTNLFLQAKGPYNGLFWNLDGQIDEQTAGMVKGLTVGAKGTYSGTLLLDGAGHGFAGTFNLAGIGSNKVTRPLNQGGPVEMYLTLLTPDTSTNTIPYVTGTISGTNTNGQAWVSTNLIADLASNISIPTSSAYTAIIPPETNSPDTAPGGDGYALLTNHNGSVKITGALADGTAFSQSTPVSAGGYIPLYASLYGNKGLLLGWLNLDPTNASGPVYWVHPALRTGLFTNAFSATNPITLSPWTNFSQAGELPTNAVPTNLTVVEMTNGVATATNVFSLTISNNFRLGGQGPEALGGTLNGKTGLLTVTLGSGANKQTGYAVILPDTTNASGGYFVTRTNSGAILLKP